VLLLQKMSQLAAAAAASGTNDDDGREKNDSSVCQRKKSNNKNKKEERQRLRAELWLRYHLFMYNKYKLAHPNIRFDCRLIRLVQIACAIQFELAVGSTLGGAYHLCHRPIPALN
jgi:hypothetical protein